MKIALIADGFSVETGSGIGRYCQERLTGLRERGVEAEPLCMKAPRMPLGEAFNHAFRLPRHVLGAASNFDVLHATSPAAGFAFPFTRKPKVVTFHDLISMLCKPNDNALHIRVLGPIIFRIIANYGDKIIADSSQTKQELVAHLGIDAGKIIVVNLGVDRRFRPMAKPQRSHHVIGSLGPLVSRKRIDYTLRAFGLLIQDYPKLNTRLLICGKGTPEHGKLAKLAATLDLADQLEFTGWIPQERLVETYNSFDVFVLSSEWEGFGLPILEAQRCGVPVIIREDAHIPQEVSKCCLKANSEQDMADKIYELLTNQELRQTMIDHGLEHSRPFTWEKTVRETLKVYEELMS